MILCYSIIDKMDLPNAGKIWSDEEVYQLLTEVREKKTMDKIAELHGRTVGGIKSRLRSIAVDYYFNDNKSIEQIQKYTGLDKETIADAIARRQYQNDKKERKSVEKTITPIQKTAGKTDMTTVIELLKDIKGLLQELIAKN